MMELLVPVVRFFILNIKKRKEKKKDIKKKYKKRNTKKNTKNTKKMTNQNIKIVYFAHLIPDIWDFIVKEQLDALKKLKLYEMASSIYMCIISNETEIIKLKELLTTEYPKVELTNVSLKIHMNILE
jgi:hypothetical protein